MTDEPQMRVVQVSSIFDETPEGMYRMDRLQRAYDAERAALDPEVRDLVDEVERRLEKRILGG